MAARTPTPTQGRAHRGRTVPSPVARPAAAAVVVGRAGRVPPGTLSASQVLELQRTAGNRAVADLLGRRPVVQRLKSISDVVPPTARVAPGEALRRYVIYLASEADRYEEGAWIRKGLEAISGLAGALDLKTIREKRKEIDAFVAALRDLEAKYAPVVVDSDITEEYKPLKACVIQSIEQIGKLGMTAANYHKKLWDDDDALKYYDMDENISPLYSRFGLTETASGEKYKDLVESLEPGRYVMNVDSPAGPNGHMFSVQVVAGGGRKANYGIPRQDPDNTQSWQPSDRILRYWS